MVAADGSFNEIVHAILEHLASSEYLISVEFVKEQIDYLITKPNAVAMCKLIKWQDSIHFYALMKNKSFNEALKWLETHDSLELHFTLTDSVEFESIFGETMLTRYFQSSLYHIIAEHYSDQAELMADILKLMTMKHHADPYLPNADGRCAYDVMQGNYLHRVPRMLFSLESHWHLFNYFTAEVLALISKVLNFGFESENSIQVYYRSLENQDTLIPTMLTPRQQVKLLMYEITLLLQAITMQSPHPPKLLEKLNALLPNACDDADLKIRLIPKRLTPDEQANLRDILTNLHKLNRLVHFESSKHLVVKRSIESDIVRVESEAMICVSSDFIAKYMSPQKRVPDTRRVVGLFDNTIMQTVARSCPWPYP